MVRIIVKGEKLYFVPPFRRQSWESDVKMANYDITHDTPASAVHNEARHQEGVNSWHIVGTPCMTIELT